MFAIPPLAARHALQDSRQLILSLVRYEELKYVDTGRLSGRNKPRPEMRNPRLPLLFAIAAYWLLEKFSEAVLTLIISRIGLGESDALTIYWGYQLLRVALAFLVGLGVGVWEKSSPWLTAVLFAGAWLLIQFARDLRDDQESTWDDIVIGGLITFFVLALPFALGCYLTQRLRRSRRAEEHSTT